MNPETSQPTAAADTASAPVLTDPAQTLRLTDETTLFLIDYHIWSGRKKLRPEDLRMGPDLPPEGLVSLGSKKVCDPDALRVFHRKRRQVERLLLAFGTRFLGGYIVPNSHAAQVLAEANGLTAEARAAAETFLAEYDRHIDAWCAAYPSWEQAIRNAVDPLEVVRGQFRFRVQALQIETSKVIAEDTLAEDLREVGETIFSEVEQIARDLEQSFLGKDALSRRALGTFRRIEDKLAALSFIDHRIDPVVHSLRDWLARLPDAGPIGGSLFLEGWALMRLVGDAQAMARHGEGLLALAELMPVAGETPGEKPANAPGMATDAIDASTPELMSEPAATSRTPPATEPPPEPITDFDDLFDDAPVTPPDVEAAAELADNKYEVARPGANTPVEPSERAAPRAVQDFWF